MDGLHGHNSPDIVTVSEETSNLVVLSQASDKFKVQHENMKSKLNQINAKCQTYLNKSYWKNMELYGKIWQYEHLNLYYCIVPKVGCTYWKRILRFVSHDFPDSRNIRKPSDIDRYFVHFGSLRVIRSVDINDKNQREAMANKAFMFTRDPFARLWSAYIDKFVLPDFWSSAKKMLKMSKENSTMEELKCVSELSFKDFLTAISNIWPGKLNEHWEPIYLICSPCHVQFAAIGKMETFADDSDYVLTSHGIHLRQNISKRAMILEEIKTLIKYNFRLERDMSKTCFNKMKVAQRLWTAFQYNGYIDRKTSFPNKEFNNQDFLLNPSKKFLEIARRTIDDQTGDFKSQRRSMMLEAYREIPKQLLDKITNIFRYDFELFGYEKDLFK